MHIGNHFILISPQLLLGIKKMARTTGSIGQFISISKNAKGHGQGLF
jgi:hypothetical protein